MGTGVLRQEVIRTIRQYGMLKKGDTVLVGVSGGPDSVYLVRVLAGLRSKFGLRDVAVCHLDHGLRGAASRADARFVRELAHSMGLRSMIGRADVAKGRKGGLSLEEAGRAARYRFFRLCARKTGARVIATGHTLDDQAETVLMRILKGSSLKGIAGIHPVRDEEDLLVIRPLVSITKDAICRALTDEGVRYCRDASNDDTAFFRNAIRHEIMPYLERYNPRLKRALSGLAEHAREDLRYINEARKGSGMTIAGRKGVVDIRLKDIAVQPKAIQKEIARDALAAAGGDIKKLTHRHWKDLTGLIAGKGTGRACDLPGDVRVRRTDSSLRFFKRKGM